MAADAAAMKPPTPPPGAAPNTYAYSSYNGGGAVGSAAAARWRREDLLDRCPLALRGAAAVVSFVSALLVASGKHGNWMEFDHYQEYRYLLAVSTVAFVYSAAQALRQASRMRRGGGGGDDAHHARSGSVIDFAGDQVLAYLLITASSAALPITNRMRSAVVNVFTDAIAASIGLAFVAFAALALSAMLSGYKLSRQTYM